MVWFGIGETPKITLILFGVLPIVTVATDRQPAHRTIHERDTEVIVVKRLQRATVGHAEDEHRFRNVGGLMGSVADLPPDGMVEIPLPGTDQVIVITAHLFSRTQAWPSLTAVTERKPEPPGPTSGRGAAQNDHLVVQRDARRVWSDGVELALTHKEFELLDYLVTHPGKVFSRPHLMGAVWMHAEPASVGSRTVDVHVHRLRRKLGRHGERLVTVKRAGYAYRPPEPDRRL